MINQDEWNLLKENEKYGMIAVMMRQIEHLEVRLSTTEKRLNDLEINTGKY